MKLFTLLFVSTFYPLESIQVPGKTNKTQNKKQKITIRAHYQDFLIPLWFHEGPGEAAQRDPGPHGNFSSDSGPEPASGQSVKGSDFHGNFAFLYDLVLIDTVLCWGFPGSSAGKESACSIGDPGSIPGSGRFPQRRDRLPNPVFFGFPGSSDGRESACNVGDLGSIPRLGRSPGGRHGNPLQYSCLENLYGQRSLAGYSPCGCKESDMTEWLRTCFVEIPRNEQKPVSPCPPDA